MEGLDFNIEPFYFVSSPPISLRSLLTSRRRCCARRRRRARRRHYIISRRVAGRVK
jgi:hypothetical protein